MIKSVIFILASLLISGNIKADEDWTSRSGQIDQEIYSVRFPNSVELKQKSGELTWYSRDGDKALYILTTCAPGMVKDPNEAVRRLMNHHSIPPKVLVSHKVSQSGDRTILDLEGMNQKTRVQTKVRYIITPKNVWELKTVFDKANEQNHNKFISSFSLN